ncbi:MAG TPA: biotin/lipoyl-binding protein, partial [Sunxiuqinia sp.]|nr:biotin/lipoyl-binding protein [Sunxiuqinia sp.]
MKLVYSLLSISLFLTLFVSCKSTPKEAPQDFTNPKVSVKTTAVVSGNINQLVRLNGRSVYLRKNIVQSSISGYIKKVNVRFGDMVHKNDLLFEIQTKENKALENSAMDTLISSKTGIITISAPADGTISELNVNSSGMFVAEGSPLCTIVENKDQVVQVNVPFEYHS